MLTRALMSLILVGLIEYLFFYDNDINPTANNRFFTETYKEARQKFQTAANAVGAELTELKFTTPKQEEYAIDVAVLKGKQDKRKVVLHISGTHGVEGHSGSAI